MDLATEVTYKKVGTKCSQIFATSDLVKIVVIDEVYGHNSDDLDVIHRRFKRFNKKTGRRKARNIRLLVVGDPPQQITIADDELKAALKERWEHHLMFMSTVWDRFDFTYAALTKVERQKDPTFKACLDVIRYYEEDRFPKCLKWLNKRHRPNYSPDRLVLAATNKTVDKINNEVLSKNTNPKFTFYGRTEGTFDMRDLTAKVEFVACVGRRVMTVNNDREGRWVNGSTGVITSVSEGYGIEVLFDTGVTEFIEPFTWKNSESYIEHDVKQDDGTVKDVMRERTLGTFTGLSIIPANSMSISKSQGITLNSPFVIDAEKSSLYTSRWMGDFGTNFIYVALSRATSIDMISLANRIEVGHIKPCYDSLAFWDYCCEQSVI
jgi:hypothetical protein